MFKAVLLSVVCALALVCCAQAQESKATLLGNCVLYCDQEYNGLTSCNDGCKATDCTKPPVFTNPDTADIMDPGAWKSACDLVNAPQTPTPVVTKQVAAAAPEHHYVLIIIVCFLGFFIIAGVVWYVRKHGQAQGRGVTEDNFQKYAKSGGKNDGFLGYEERQSQMPGGQTYHKY